MRSACVSQPQSPQVTPRLAKKRKKRARQEKAASTGLEDFLDWTGVADIDLVKEEEMFSLAVGFAA